MKLRHLFFGLPLILAASILAQAQGTRLLRRPSVSRESVA